MVALVTMVVVGMALAPAGAQLVDLPGSSTTTPATPTTTLPESTTTTLSQSSTTGVTASTSTTSGSAGARSGARSSPSTTVRRSPSTTALDGASPTSSSLLPTTTVVEDLVGNGSTTTTGDLTLEQTSTTSAMSTGSLVALIIAGLLAVALGLSALTFRYVRTTRPPDRFVA